MPEGIRRRGNPPCSARNARQRGLRQGVVERQQALPHHVVNVDGDGRELDRVGGIETDPEMEFTSQGEEVRGRAVLTEKGRGVEDGSASRRPVPTLGERRSDGLTRHHDRSSVFTDQFGHVAVTYHLPSVE